MARGREEAADVGVEMGKKLRDMRRTRGLTLRNAADIAGISPGYLSHIERGAKIPKSRIIITLCNVYGENPHPLLTLAEPEKGWTLVLDQVPPQEEWRSYGIQYTNAINDPSFRYLRLLEIRKIGVTEDAKDFIAEIYSRIWEFLLTPDRVEEIYAQAVRDPTFRRGEVLRHNPEVPPFDVKRAIAEIYLRFKAEEERSRGMGSLVDAQNQVGQSKKRDP